MLINKTRLVFGRPSSDVPVKWWLFRKTPVFFTETSSCSPVLRRALEEAGDFLRPDEVVVAMMTHQRHRRPVWRLWIGKPMCEYSFPMFTYIDAKAAFLDFRKIAALTEVHLS
jgi:hypothetical protein